MSEPTTITLNQQQQLAVDLIASGGICIITGGAGVGKTTTLKAALQHLETQAKEKGRPTPFIILTAPTGKAARRMAEATGREACTLHRLLGYDSVTGGWTHNATNPLPEDVVVVDESSMLDIFLASGLLEAIDPRRTRVVFVGDVNQLPSVGPGRVLGDLIEVGRVPVVRLTEVHRQAAKSWVYRNAPLILEGGPLSLEDTDDFQFVEIEDPNELAKSVVDIYESELNRWADANGSGNDESTFDAVQILSPQRKGPIGTEVLNTMIQEAIQGKGQTGWKVDDNLQLLDGDKVLQTKNNYELAVMNGETGMVQGASKGKLIVHVDGEEKSYSETQSKDLILGYAMTIHKMQGSQSPTCIVICHSSHTHMLSRQLFYTAVTRVQERLVLVGDRKGVERALGNARVAERQTGLVEHLRRAVGDGSR